MKELSRMTPRLWTRGEGEAEELSMIHEKLSALARLDFMLTSIGGGREGLGDPTVIIIFKTCNNLKVLASFF